MGTLAATSQFILNGQWKGSGALANPIVDIAITKSQQWANGTGDNAANQFWQISTTANATTDTYELDSALSDDFGTSLVFTTIKLLMILNTSTTAGDQLVIAGDFMTGAVGGAHNLDPGGILYATSPIDEYTVTGDLTDTLTIASGANVVTYQMILLGTV